MVIPLLAALQLALMGGGGSTPNVFVKNSPADKRQLTPADYASWDEVITSDLTPDGKVFAVEFKRDGLSRVEWRETAASQKYTIEEAQEPRFSPDGKWLTYLNVSGKTKDVVAKNLQQAEAIFVTGAESIKFVGSDAFFEGDNFFAKVNLETRKRQEFSGVDQSWIQDDGSIVWRSHRGNDFFLNTLGSDNTYSSQPWGAAKPIWVNRSSTGSLAVMSLEGTHPQLKAGEKVFSTLRLPNFPTGYRISATPAPKLLDNAVEFSIVKPGITDLPKIFNPQDAGYLGTERTFRCVWFPSENRFEQVENGTWLNAQIGGTGKWAIVENPEDPTLAFPGFRFPREQWLLNIGTGDLRNLAGNSTEPAALNEKRSFAVIKTATGWNWIDLNQGTVTPISGPSGAGDSAPTFVGDKAICFAGGKVVTIEKGIAKTAEGTKSGLTFSYRASGTAGTYLAAEETATGKIGIAIFSNGVVKTQIESATLSGLKTYGGKVTFLRQSYEESPNVMIANSDLSNPELLTDTNTQQDEFFWGKAIPVPGATLITPANPGEGKSPLVVNVYERMAGRGYEYSTPKADSAYSIQGWSQDGYYVLLPDITYEPNKPGESAKKSVEAILTNLKKQYADKIDFDRVAIAGHSWGGYESLMIASTSKMFRCAIAGSPITDLISLQGQEYEVGKVPHSTVLQYGQGHLTGPFWDYVREHEANSPIFNLKSLETPILMAYGGKDSTVPPSQSQELFHAMRRLAKKGVFLEYTDDDHSLSSPATKKDYARKVREWLARYLKGESPMPWMITNR